MDMQCCTQKDYEDAYLKSAHLYKISYTWILPLLQRMSDLNPVDDQEKQHYVLFAITEFHQQFQVGTFEH